MSFDIGSYWRNKKALSVPQCDSLESGLYAIGIAELYPEKERRNPARITKKLREHIKKYNTDGFTTSGMTEDEMVKFEKQNPQVRIQVYGADTNEESYEVLKPSGSPNVILMLFKNPDGICHWAVIRDHDRLICMSKGNTKKWKKLICTNCHNKYYSQAKLDFHKEMCLNNEEQIIVMPKPGQVIKFKNYKNMMFVPVVMYADFECYQKNGKHTPSGFGLYVKSIDDNIYNSKYISRTFDGNVPKEFVRQVLEIRDEIDKMGSRKMMLTKEDWSHYESTNICWICNGEISISPGVRKSDSKVKDHCHFTGKYRGPAHSKCNLLLRRQRFIPVVFHNMKGYDSHLFIRAFSGIKEVPGGIPENEQKFKMITLTKNGSSQIKFLDSLEFKDKTLDKLVKELSDYPILRSDPEIGKHFEIFRRKGVFPYEWFDSFEKLSETEFPPHSEFTSSLNGGKNISEDDYEYVKFVYEKFCKNFGEFHDLYMKVDVLLHADVMENFRKDAYGGFKLDPFNYITQASYAWDCVLKFSGVELEMLSDQDMYMFFEKGKRGGYSNCHKSYSKANHKYLPNFDPTMPCIFIMYWDINSQYPTVMILPLPVKNFAWLMDWEIDEIMELIEQGRHHEIQPCTLMVDLMHDPKNIEMEKIFAMCPDFYEGKLCLTLFEKKKYIIHHRALKQYIDYGMIVTNVHTGISYDEYPWMKGYIEYCVEKRKEAMENKIESLVQFWKDMMNKPYGKTMEEVRNRIDFRLVNNKKELDKLIKDPLFQYETSYANRSETDFLLGVRMKKPKATLNKPIYTGQCILDDSKMLMYNFIYDYCMKKWADGKFKVCQTDTDSVIALRSKRMIFHSTLRMTLKSCLTQVTL